MAKPSFKRQLLEREVPMAATPVGIPQMNPFEPRPLPTPPVGAPLTTTAVAPPPDTPSIVAAEAQTAATPSELVSTEPVGRQLITRSVDTSERLQQRGFHMYPQRHRQLLELAFIEERKPWQIIDDALDAYVRKHHGKPKLPTPS